MCVFHPSAMVLSDVIGGASSLASELFLKVSCTSLNDAFCTQATSCIYYGLEEINGTSNNFRSTWKLGLNTMHSVALNWWFLIGLTIFVLFLYQARRAGP